MNDNVLIAGMDHCQSVEIVRVLGKDRDRQVVGLDRNPAAIALASKYCLNKYVVSDYGALFEEKLFTICEQEKIGFVWPIGNQEILAVGPLKKKLEARGICLPIPDYDVHKIALDKYLTAELAVKKGVPHPRTVLVKRGEAIGNGFTFPVVIKPNFGTCAGLGVTCVENIKELEESVTRLFPLFDEIVLQEFIPGDNSQTMFSVQNIFDHEHKPVIAQVHRKVRGYRTSKLTGGSGTCQRIVNNNKVRDVGVAMVEAFEKWVGIVNVEVKVDPRDGIAKVIEVNPRPPFTTSIIVRSGVDVPHMMLKIARRQRVAAPANIRSHPYYVMWPDDITNVGELLYRLIKYRDRESWTYLMTYPATYLPWKSRVANFQLDDCRPLINRAGTKLYGEVLKPLLVRAGLKH